MVYGEPFLFLCNLLSYVLNNYVLKPKFEKENTQHRKVESLAFPKNIIPPRIKCLEPCSH